MGPMQAGFFRIFAILLLMAGAGCDDSSGGGGGGDTGGDDDAGADTGTPEGCSADDECAADEYCANGDCREGCRLSPDNCREGEICDADLRLCLDAACNADRDCPANAWCDDGTCRQGCREGGCTEPQVCDLDTRTCVGGDDQVCCTRDGQCLAGTDACDGQFVQADSCDPNPCAPGCTVDAECPESQYCADGACRDGCRHDVPGACPEGEVCGANHRCAVPECESDNDCLALGQDAYCLEAFGECRQACNGDRDCPQGFYCDQKRCQRGCQDNVVVEPNDNAAQAVELRFDPEGVADGDDGILCPLNSDWFRVDVDQPGFRLRAILDCDGADLGLEILDADGAVLARSNEPGCAEQAEWPERGLDAQGTFYVRVFGAAPEDGVAYELVIHRLDAQALCDPDRAEPDDAPAQATALLRDGDQSSIEGRTACPGDADWFSLPLGDGDGLTIEVEARGNDSGANGALTFDLTGPGAPPANLDPSLPQVLHPNESVEGEDGTETLRLELPRGNQFIREGVWYLRVRGDDADQYATYDLRVVADRRDAACIPDDLEPNEARAAATDLMARPELVADGALRPNVELRVPDLSLCAGDADWYRVTLGADDRLAARVTVRDPNGMPALATGSIRVAVVDGRGQVIGPAGSDQGPEISARSPAVPAAGDYFVRVTGAEGARAPRYDLTLVRTPGGVACDDDRFDDAVRNDGRVSASLLEIEVDGQLTAPNLNLCNVGAGPNGDADWYAFDLDTEGRLTIDLTFAHADGDLDLEIYRDGVAAPLATSESTTDNEQVVVAHAPAGRYYVHVYSFVGEENVYDLAITHESAAICEPDRLESNDERADAVLAGPGFDEDDLWICERPQDLDWFRVDVPGGATRTFHVDFFRDDDGWITVDVYDGGGAFVRTLDANLDGQCAVIEPRGGATTWYFAVGARSFDRGDATPDRVEYRVRVGDGDRCAEYEPLLPGVVWPRL